MSAEKEKTVVEEAAEKAASRADRLVQDPEPSLSRRLGQIGVLGWAIVTPILIGLLVGHWLDKIAGTKIMFSAALIMVGAAAGMWSAWRWMHKHG